MLVARQPRAAPENIKSLFIGSEFKGQRQRSADVRHVVIEDALARLTPGERRRGARRKIFVDPIIGREDENFAHVRAVEAAIIANKEPAHRTDGKRSGETNSVARINIELIPLRRGRAGAEAYIRVRA